MRTAGVVDTGKSVNIQLCVVKCNNLLTVALCRKTRPF